jgi:hypothetical protein
VNQAEAGRLLTHYLNGELSLDERRQLMDAILSEQSLFNAFAEELILSRMLEETGFFAKVSAAVQPAPRGLRRIAESVRNWTTDWRLAAVAVGVVLVLAATLVFQPAGRGSKKPSIVPAMLTFVLTPSVRGLDGENKIPLSGQSTVRLLMDVGEDPFAAYRVVVESADKRYKRAFDGVEPHRTSGGSWQIALEFRLGSLEPGDYTITIVTLMPSGSTQLAGGYSFSAQ